MAFWKQSEDPWDKRDGVSAPPREPKESPIDSLKAWNSQRRAAAKEKEAAKHLPPEPCPWCGTDMEQGFLTGGQDTVYWYSGVHSFVPFFRLGTEDIRVLDEGGPFAGYYKVAWLCRECGKIVFSIPESERIYDFPESHDEEASEKKEETSEE